MIKLDVIAEELFNKIRARFPEITLGDSDGNIINDPSQARYFDFEYVIGEDNNIGNISVSLDEEEGLSIIFSKDIIDEAYGSIKQDWFNFLKEMRMFSKKRLMKFEVRDINRTNLTKRDYQFLAQNRPGDRAMAESKMYGTTKTSYQKIGNARLAIKHSAPINTESSTGRTQKIKNIYIESPEGERFKFPYKHLNGARALARHVSEGGNAYDDFGKHIASLSEELYKLRKFNQYLNKNSVMAETLSEYTPIVKDRVNEIKKEIFDLQKETYYKQAFENFEPKIIEDIPTDVEEAWVEQLTIKQFNEELKDVFPYVYNLIGEKSIKEIDLDEMVNEGNLDTETHTVSRGETVYSIAKQYNVPVEDIIEINGLDDRATIYAGQRLVLPLQPSTDIGAGGTREIGPDGNVTGSTRGVNPIESYENILDDALGQFGEGKKRDVDGDGDIDSDDYMAAKDIAIKKSMDKDDETSESKTPLGEFILSYFDRETGQFPKGPTAVLTMVEKEYGDRFVKPAQQFIERVNTKVAEVMGYKEESEISVQDNTEVENIKNLAGLR